MKRKFIISYGFRKKYQEFCDEELVVLYKQNNCIKIIDEFFERYVHLVYALCMKYYRNEEHARDTTMIIFESLEEKLKKFEIQNFKSWLYIVARNACLMELRKKKHEIPVERIELFRSGNMENPEEMHRIDEEKQPGDDLEVYMYKLNNNQRVCLDMMYFQNKSYREIAAETGLSLKEVKSHIQNGKRNLRNFLKQGDEE